MLPALYNTHHNTEFKEKEFPLSDSLVRRKTIEYVLGGYTFESGPFSMQ